MYGLIRLYQKWIVRPAKRIRTSQLIALIFLLIIAVGTVLLMLPVAAADGVSAGFVTALFTATSATCVTGLSLVDTYMGWTAFGQTVILCMIQLGGLGFMSVASLVVFALRRKVGLKQRLVMAQALSVSDMEGVVRLQKLVLVGSLGIEAVGALILALRFWPVYGLRKALIWGLFHSISAFCNAGFDIFGELSPGSSLMLFQSDPVVLLTIGALIIFGGLGFFVWEEVARLRSLRKCSVYTKLVLITTGVLLIIGTVLVALLEWNNPKTLGPMDVGDKLLNSFFQSVTCRTAGFASISQAGLTEAGKAVSMVLMMIGGSSGSTAGGIKTVTLMVLMLFLWSRIRGKGSVSVFKRTIPDGQVMDAVTICGIVLSLALFGGIVISATCGIGFADSLYEAISALATVGLTADVTGELNMFCRFLIIIYMYFGRVGVLTISLGFLIGDNAQERYRYAHTNLLIG